jgi:TROVE domain
MPIGALLRNLGSLTQLGVLKINSYPELQRVADVLTNKQYLRKGRIHPIPRIVDIKVNPHAQAVYVTLAVNQLSLVDPNDHRSWDFAGFDPGAPRAIQMIANGEV